MGKDTMEGGTYQLYCESSVAGVGLSNIDLTTYGRLSPLYALAMG